ncbi:MAG: glutamate--tRNA ligase [Candidatus Zixiibacteriota bacterium]
MEKARTRFAPSPTGKPHIGNIRTALFAWLWARHTDGDFILRIEDTDRERYQEEAMSSIFEAMKWLGLDWNEGPEKGGEYGPYLQSERLDIYHKHAQRLLESGNAYWCDCTKERLSEVREKQRKNKEHMHYDRRCLDRNLESSFDDPNTVLRLRIPDTDKVVFNDFIRGEIEFSTEELDDIVLIKSDGYPTYHFAFAVDDTEMGITHIMRGEEYIPSSGMHKALFDALEFDMPHIVHLPLILGPDKGKLSKRHGATSVLDYKKMGFLPEAIFNFIALMGWSPGDDREIITPDEMVELFDIKNIHKSAAVFDPEKLLWMNGEYIRAMSPEELDKKLRPYYEGKGWKADDDFFLKIAGSMQERLKKLTDMVDNGWFWFEDPTEYQEKGIKKHFKPEAVQRLQDIYDSLESIENWEEKEIEDAIRSCAKKREEGAGKLIHPMRLSTSGLTYGPSAFDIILFLPKETILRRIKNAQEFVKKLHGVQ